MHPSRCVKCLGKVAEVEVNWLARSERLKSARVGDKRSAAAGHVVAASHGGQWAPWSACHPRIMTKTRILVPDNKRGLWAYFRHTNLHVFDFDDHLLQIY